jgi:hypothetical protein
LGANDFGLLLIILIGELWEEMMRYVAALLKVADAATFGMKITCDIQYYFSPGVLLQELFGLESHPSRPGNGTAYEWEPGYITSAYGLIFLPSVRI